MLLLDEPTSGLDTSSAIFVIDSIRSLVQASHGNLGVMLTVHQPSLEILRLIDHFLLLSKGRSVFFGTLKQAGGHFRELGFPAPINGTPTDYYLQVARVLAFFFT